METFCEEILANRVQSLSSVYIVSNVKKTMTEDEIVGRLF